MDPITEIIAHFSGVFSIQLERARMREEYDEFEYMPIDPGDPSAINQISVTVHTPYTLGDAEPKVDYEHDWPEFPPLPQEYFEYVPPFTPDPDLPFHEGSDFASFPHIGNQWPGDFIETSLRILLEPAGSVAIFVRQSNQLLDRDIITNSPFEFDPLPFSAFETQLSNIIKLSDELSVIAAPAPPADEEAIMAIIEEAANTLKALHEGTAEISEGALMLGEDAYGMHTNGIEAEEVAQFETALKRHEDPASENEQTTPLAPPAFDENGAPDRSGSNAPAKAEGETLVVNGSSGGASGLGGFDIRLGDNAMFNETVFAAGWTGAPVIAVLGDYITLQIISQINIWQNSDDAGFVKPIDDLAINTASITEAFGSGATRADEADESSSFPQNWAIARLETNLVSFNWTEQFSEIYDEDIVNWQHGGSELFLQMGSNVSANLTSLAEYGLQYDLIIVSGSIFEANIIDQRNILLDDDRLYENEWPSGADVTIASSGNTLWNGAQIHTVGHTDFAALPASYTKAAKKLGQGDNEVSKTILADENFAGLDFLNVLYIEGNLLDLNYVRQTNILSDADQLGFITGTLEGDGTTDTGGNLLANLATIIDLESDTTAYVGGEVYSDALLYQANLIENAGPMVPLESQDLASEAVIFLAEDMLHPSPDETHEYIVTTSSSEAQSVDVMQSMTG